MSAIAAPAPRRRAAAISGRAIRLLGTQDKMTSRTCLAETIHEIAERRILPLGGDRFERLESFAVARFEGLPELVQPLPLFGGHGRHRFPHLDRGRPPAQHDPA